MARYEFTIDLPIYLPQAAIDELKTRLRDRVKEIAARCGEYQVDLEVKMKMAPSTAEENGKTTTNGKA